MKHTLALVSYLNTRPFIDGLNHVFSNGEVTLNLLPPAECPTQLASGVSDMALVPVGSLIDFEGLALLKDHCIGADGAVDSVYVFSQVPIQEAEIVLLDSHSRTSNGLTRILMKSHWRHQPQFSMPEERDFSLIQGKTAGVAIGDQAYKIKDQFQYVYDLSEVWKDYTGLPFVFAVWAYRPEFWTQTELAKVHTALEWGRANRKSAAARWGKDFGYSLPEAEQYLCHSIQYELDHAKHQALERYFKELKELS